MIAASCLLYANQLLNPDAIWNARHVQITSYIQLELHECTLAIAELYLKTYHVDEITSSILRRYLKAKKDDDQCHRRVREIIHASKLSGDEDEVLDLTLDEIDDDDDDEDMSMEYHRQL